MKKLFKLTSLLFVAVAMFATSCEKEKEPVNGNNENDPYAINEANIIGKWRFLEGSSEFFQEYLVLNKDHTMTIGRKIDQVYDWTLNGSTITGTTSYDDQTGHYTMTATLNIDSIYNAQRNMNNEPLIHMRLNGQILTTMNGNNYGDKVFTGRLVKEKE